MPRPQQLDIGSLRDGLEGQVVGPNDNGWELARQDFNLTIDQRPELVAFPASASDVVQLVEF